MTLPDCMMPDGAEPCLGYRELRAENDTLRAMTTCCCGDDMDNHGYHSGHGPVSQYDYALRCVEEEVDRWRTVGRKLVGSQMDLPRGGRGFALSELREAVDDAAALLSVKRDTGADGE